MLQSRSDFVKGQAGVNPSLSVQEECLGLAVLDLWCHAKEQGHSLKEICKRVGYFKKHFKKQNKNNLCLLIHYHVIEVLHFCKEFLKNLMWQDRIRTRRN